MKKLDLHKLSLAESSQLIHNGHLSPVDYLEALLNRTNKLEPHIKAWVTLNENEARKTAEKRTSEAESGIFRGPLRGIPIGIKDIFYTAGIKTTMGSPICRAFIPSFDARSVETLTNAGAIIFGKTETTEFAVSYPTPTHNPWNLDHTPGGSSSGSAAAVSSGMCPAALGTQTGGSVVRPASYCGIVGMKPTYDLINTHGVYPYSWTFDTVGFFTRTVEDAKIVFETLTKNNEPKLKENSSEENLPRLGLLRSYFQENAELVVWENFEASVDLLRNAGARIFEKELPKVFDHVYAAQSVIKVSEAASVHEENFMRRRNDYSVNLRRLIASGFMVSASDYVRAKRVQIKFVNKIAELFKNVDCLVTPSTTTPALYGLGRTGSPAFNTPWSFGGFPAITIPIGLTQDGLPLGLQIISSILKDGLLLSVASWAEKQFHFPKELKEPI
jgi:aspartyl-tRNA(Asn)/glutamyl-tRNA(Gln) amidotransferase subunit A